MPRAGDWLPRGKLGWADLVRALDVGGPRLLQTTAALLGLEAEEPPPSAPSPALITPAAAAPQASAVSPPSLGCDPMPQLAFWMLTSLKSVATEEEPEPRTLGTTALPVWRSRPAPASYVPLNRWEALLPRLRRELAVARPSRSPDIGEIVRRLGRGDSLDRLPRRSQRRWGAAIQIIEDRSRRLTPYWRDQAMVCGRLQRLFARHSVCRGLVDDALDLPSDLRLGAKDDNDWLPPLAGGAVLVLGDLGHLGGRDGRARTFWADIGCKAARAGCRALAITPVAPAAYDEELAAHWTLLGWERRSIPVTVDQLAAQAERLIDLLSTTVRVEPGLLRDVRRLLGFTAAAESAFWQHSAVTSDSSVAATLDPAQLKRRRARFEALASPLRHAIWERTRAWRARLPGEVYLQEAALLDGAAFSLLPEEEHVLLADFVDILSAQIRGIEGAAAPGGAEEWFLRLMRLASQSEPIWRRRSVHRLWAALRDRLDVTDPPPGFAPGDIAPDPHVPELTLEIAQAGDELLLRDVGVRDEAAASPVGRIATRNHWVIVEAEASRDSFWESGQPPPWAMDWGWDDEYGAWVAFSVDGKDGTPVVQRMRWIEPGTFQMGSPEDEPERYDDEGPLHEVRIEEGFWLFETACTQALWEAVMGENPARFKGAQRPVEQVSWDDVQRFIATLNERVPGLDLRLPSEAHWEYACRAGTDTPFSFGGNITPEQVNYDGNHPYHGGEKGAYRQETVPVGSLPANPWGLCEMHGNVDEWVQDTWQGSYEGALSDGSPWESAESGAPRVIRGGSWVVYARGCRCACRGGDEPDIRDFDLGFRCSRAQGREPGPAGSGASGLGVARPAGERGPFVQWTKEAERTTRPDVGAGAGGNRERIAREGSDYIEDGHRGGGSRSGGQRVEPTAGPVLLRLDTTAQSAVQLPDAPAVEIRSDRERLTLRRIERPRWASAMGRDRFGLWAEISVESSHGEPVIQRLRWIPPGRFLMGSPPDEPGRDDDEGPQHLVTIATGYWLFDTPCTQDLWQMLMGKNPSEFRSPGRPVEQVSWNDVQGFLEALNDRLGEADGRFQLPSEAQWEYASRAGTEAALYNGPIEILGDANAPALDAIAWYGGNSSVDFELENGQERTWLSAMQYPEGKAGTHPVKGKLPNPWGLYDMLGNVWEWTQDTWEDSYEGAPDDGSAREGTDAGAARVIRGGSWILGARYCRCAYRGGGGPENRYNVLGFRCARAQV